MSGTIESPSVDRAFLVRAAPNGTVHYAVEICTSADELLYSDRGDLDSPKLRERLVAALPTLDPAQLQRCAMEVGRLVRRAREASREEGSHTPATTATAQPHPSDEEITALWESCKSLAQRQDILGAAIDEVQGFGVAGVGSTVGALVLCTTSTQLATRPVSAVIKGPSGAGKSFVAEQASRLFPPEYLYTVTSMSERAILYDEEPLAHRMMIFYEAAGIQGTFGTYLIRSLLSEGKLRYKATIEGEDGKRTTQTVERDGPTGLITTTTLPALHAENETRMLTLTVPDDREQTQRILDAIAEESDVEPDLTTWHAYFRWLMTGEHRVTVPYAKSLGSLIQPVHVRLRRDFKALLQLVRAHALLHRATRPCDAAGRIVATLADYAAVRACVGCIIAQGVDATVPATVRETVKAAAALLGGKPPGGTITNAALAQCLGVDKSTALRRGRVALEKGFLVNLEDKRGRPAKLALGDPVPDDLDLLPDAETVRAVWQPEGLKSCNHPSAAPTTTSEGGCTVAPVAEVCQRGVREDDVQDPDEEPWPLGDAWEGEQ